MQIWSRLKHHFHEVAKTPHSPHSIALGFAIGSFIALLPLPIIGIIIAIIIALVSTKINKFALFGAMIFWNPIMQIPIYFGSYAIGDFFFDAEPIIKFQFTFLNVVYNFSRRYLIGNFILSSLLSIVSYFACFHIVKYIRHRHYMKTHLHYE